jgi:hypothetical protein
MTFPCLKWNYWIRDESEVVPFRASSGVVILHGLCYEFGKVHHNVSNKHLYDKLYCGGLLNMWSGVIT